MLGNGRYQFSVYVVTQEELPEWVMANSYKEAAEIYAKYFYDTNDVSVRQEYDENYANVIVTGAETRYFFAEV